MYFDATDKGEMVSPQSSDLSMFARGGLRCCDFCPQQQAWQQAMPYRGP